MQTRISFSFASGEAFEWSRIGAMVISAWMLGWFPMTVVSPSSFSLCELIGWLVEGMD